MTNQNISDHAKETQVSALTDALRTMRKYGFIIVQDKLGQKQSDSDQFHRAQQVAGAMLNEQVDNSNELLNNLASEILKAANAGSGLDQIQ